MKTCRLIAISALLFAFGQHLQAQVKVDMGIERRLYVLYEPIPITVVITNLSGHDLDLEDADTQKWFSFQITYVGGDEKRIVPPMDVNYKLPGLHIPAGATVKHTINLATMYAVQDIGLYRIRASVYLPDMRKYYSSPQDELEISEAKLFWQQTVGVPAGIEGAGSQRTLSLLTFRQPKYNMLYVRVEDKDAGTIYTTSALGPLLAGFDPDVKLDKKNLIHVLQLVGPRSYLYSRIGLNGEMFDQLSYNAVTSRPVLKKDPEGEVFVLGGQLDVPVPATTAGASGSGPKISDRPPGFPTPSQPNGQAGGQTSGQ